MIYKVLHKVLLTIGLVMLAVGGFPWLYTPALMHDRQNGEAAGMTGTLIFLFVGVPGLLLTSAGIALWSRQRRKG